MHEIGSALVSNLAKVVAVSVLGVLAAATAIDLWLELQTFPPLGSHIKEWSRRYPGFMAFLASQWAPCLGISSSRVELSFALSQDMRRALQ
jgi:hypothetical protein